MEFVASMSYKNTLTRDAVKHPDFSDTPGVQKAVEDCLKDGQSRVLGKMPCQVIVSPVQTSDEFLPVVVQIVLGAQVFGVKK